jgi:hypothetical protein
MGLRPCREAMTAPTAGKARVVARKTSKPDLAADGVRSHKAQPVTYKTTNVNAAHASREGGGAFIPPFCQAPVPKTLRRQEVQKSWGPDGLFRSRRAA